MSAPISLDELNASCPIIEKLKVLLDREEICSICLDVLIAPFDHVRKITKCGHHFHDECLFQWLTKQNGTCPVCRTCPVEPKPREISVGFQSIILTFEDFEMLVAAGFLTGNF